MDTYVVTLRGCLDRPDTPQWGLYEHVDRVCRLLKERLGCRVYITERLDELARHYHAEFTLSGIEVEAESEEDAIKRATANLRRVLKRTVCRYGRLTIY